MNDITIIVSSITLVILIFLFLLYKKFINPKESTEEVREFILGLKKEIYENVILKFVEEVDFSKLGNEDNDVTKYIIDLLHTNIDYLHNRIYDYISDRLEDYVKLDSNPLTEISLRVVKKKPLIDNFITSVIEYYNVEKKMFDSIEKAWIKYQNNALKDDKELEEKYSDSEKYNVCEISEEDLKSLEKITEEDLPKEERERIQKMKEKVIPPSEDGSDVYDEVIEEEDNTFIDANGRRRDKKTGRFK